MGVRAGISISDAKKRLYGKNAVFLPTDHEFYDIISDSVMVILKNYTDRFEQVSVDEAFLDASSRIAYNFERGRKLAMTIKDEIVRKEKLTCSIGVGPNKSLAKIASEFRKPDGLTVVSPDKATAFLAPLPVGKLYGVGKKTEERMKNLGIETVNDLANYDADKLSGIFGKKLATYFHDTANGVDDEPVNEREGRKQLSAYSTLNKNTRLEEQILPELERLSQRVHNEVLDEELIFRSISIIAILENRSIHTRSKTLGTPVQNLDILKKMSRQLFKNFLEYERNLTVRRIGVKVSNLTKKSGQKTLADFYTS
uniref:DNA-directed DNA polymerase n=1 Tax=uncultured marine thaumarchaeote KM3_73_F02 TaxID=1456268 RepID=A0A075HPI3_9ARCH|nr:DNA-damage-inducible protein P [uncultured marine thaumarchaeote KM3_73_F02]